MITRILCALTYSDFLYRNKIFEKHTKYIQLFDKYGTSKIVHFSIQKMSGRYSILNQNTVLIAEYRQRQIHKDTRIGTIIFLATKVCTILQILLAPETISREIVHCFQS